MKSAFARWMARTKKPKVQIKRQKVSLGWAYRIYIDGMYMGASFIASIGSRWRSANARHLRPDE